MFTTTTTLSEDHARKAANGVIVSITLAVNENGEVVCAHCHDSLEAHGTSLEAVLKARAEILARRVRRANGEEISALGYSYQECGKCPCIDFFTEDALEDR